MATEALFPPIEVVLEGERSYQIAYNPLKDLPALMEDAGLRRGRVLIVTDMNVAKLYREPVEEAFTGARWEPGFIILPPGENTKSPEHLGAIYDQALVWGLDRKTPVVALGGGVVGDLAGYAAATLLRGIPLVQVPTTLIAQVDSAIGGKTGINHRVGKNLIGAFHQPRLVCTDLATTWTLPEREWHSGLAEVVKHALILDPDFFERLEAEWPELVARDHVTLGPIIHRAAEIKVEVVTQDERENGLRAILNFGHTFGHAIEKVAGYGTFTHGEAVALGMRAALYASSRIVHDFPLERTDALVRQIPVQGTLSTLSVEDLTDAMKTDKKAEAGTIRFVLLDAIGEAKVQSGLSDQLIRDAWLYAMG